MLPLALGFVETSFYVSLGMNEHLKLMAPEAFWGGEAVFKELKHLGG